MTLKIISPQGIGRYLITSITPQVSPGSDTGYGVGGAGAVTVDVTGTAGTFKIVNVSAGNGYPFIVDAVMA